MKSIVNIPKEEVANLHFHRLKSTIDRRIIGALYKAMFLGNVFLQKVRIYFHADEGDRMIETTVWSTTDEYISIKGGLTIPVSCIFRVETI